MFDLFKPKEERKESIYLVIPTSFRDSGIGRNSALEEKARLIEDNSGKVVMVDDFHHSVSEGDFRLARVLYDPKDLECFYAQWLRDKSLIEDRLHYPDLRGLMIQPNVSGASYQGKFQLIPTEFTRLRKFRTAVEEFAPLV